MTNDECLAIRKEEALKIDPATAQVEWWFAFTLDPYGFDPDLPDECKQVGREYFARNSGSDVWGAFRDLPTDTHDALWEHHKDRIAFPAGLEGILTTIDDCNGGQCKI